MYEIHSARYNRGRHCTRMDGFRRRLARRGKGSLRAFRVSFHYNHIL